jgi:hypothetical protein
MSLQSPFRPDCRTPSKLLSGHDGILFAASRETILVSRWIQGLVYRGNEGESSRRIGGWSGRTSHHSIDQLTALWTTGALSPVLIHCLQLYVGIDSSSPRLSGSLASLLCPKSFGVLPCVCLGFPRPAAAALPSSRKRVCTRLPRRPALPSTVKLISCSLHLRQCPSPQVRTTTLLSALMR